MDKTNEKLEKAKKIFEEKLNKLNSKDFKNQLENLREPEEKERFAKDNNLSMNELNELLNTYGNWKHWQRIHQNTWDAAFKSRSGVDFSTDIQKSGDEAGLQHRRYAYLLEKSAISRMTYEFTPEELTPELMDIMQENGYEGKTGSKEFQESFKNHLQNKENERIAQEKRDRIDRASYNVKNLADSFVTLSNDMRETDSFLGELSYNLGLRYSSHAPTHQINSISQTLSHIDSSIHQNDLSNDTLRFNWKKY